MHTIKLFLLVVNLSHYLVTMCTAGSMGSIDSWKKVTDICSDVPSNNGVDVSVTSIEVEGAIHSREGFYKDAGGADERSITGEGELTCDLREQKVSVYLKKEDGSIISESHLDSFSLAILNANQIVKAVNCFTDKPITPHMRKEQGPYGFKNLRVPPYIIPGGLEPGQYIFSFILTSSVEECQAEITVTLDLFQI